MISRFALSAVLLLTAGTALAYDPYGGARPDADMMPAQLYNRPPADFDGPRDPETGPDPGALLMRIDRLERDIRRLTGQNEELQHKVQVLEEQLRVREPASAAPVAPADPGAARPFAASPPPPAAPSPPATPVAGGRRSDAFDPTTAPTAPGAPRPLGTTTPSAPLTTTPKVVGGSATTTAPVREVGQPLDIAHGRLVGEQPPAAEVAPAPDAVPPGPKEEYEEAVATLKSGKFEAAEKSLEAFLTRNPKSKFAPAATFNLGESFFLRGRHREAAEKYLEISQKYGQSAQAPDALLRLGQSLGAMGAKEQACASFNEIGVKYPGSAARIRDAAQRESRKLQC